MRNTIPVREHIIILLMILLPFITTAQSYLPRYHDTTIITPFNTEIQAYSFPLENVKLLESPFLHAMKKDGEWLISLEPDRLLSRVREYAGLEPKGVIYGGWESSSLSSHSLGHYLSALSMYYAATGEPEYLSRVNYILAELDTCQQIKGTGYIGGIPDQDNVFTQVASGILEVESFNLNGAWSPWYTVHKIFAGLLDAYFYTGNSLAREIVIKYADWVIQTTENLTREQFQYMLGCEYGGMNEVLANIYAITGDEKYMTMSKRFYHENVLDPLYNQQDHLSGLHANTQVPKIIGCARQYELSGIDSFRIISDFFWSRVVNHHSYCNGGSGNNEYFGPPDQLNNELGTNTTESCVTYNMLKLTGHLFSWTANVKYVDYFEKALYNHILASQNPSTGMVCYFTPLSTKPYTKSYSSALNDFWCCVGTGWENHAKYAEQIYFHDTTGIFVNLYIPSVLSYDEKGIIIKQQTKYPDNDTIHFTLNMEQPVELNLRFRCPDWAHNGMQIFINGTEFAHETESGSYANIERFWNNQDSITLVIPMDVYLEAMPDNQNRKAFFYGPVLLCNQLGSGDLLQIRDVPVIVTDNDSADYWTQKITGDSIHLVTDNVGELVEADMVPLFRLHDQQYTALFDFYTTTEWPMVEEEYLKIIDSLANLNAITSDFVIIADQQSENEHNYLGSNSSTGEFNGNMWRHATDGGWFSYVLAINEPRPLQLVCTYWGSDSYGRTFDILVDETVIATETLDFNKPGEFYNEIYPIPDYLVAGKSSITVKFDARPGMYAGGIFGLRLMYSGDDLLNAEDKSKQDKKSFKLYHANGKLYVNATSRSNVQLNIYNCNGILKYSKFIQSSHEIIDLDLPAGLYIATPLNSPELLAVKFIVQ